MTLKLGAKFKNHFEKKFPQVLNKTSKFEVYFEKILNKICVNYKKILWKISSYSHRN